MSRVKLNEQLSLSRMAYGMWRLGDDEDTSPARVQAKVDACLAQGITTMDQAASMAVTWRRKFLAMP